MKNFVLTWRKRRGLQQDFGLYPITLFELRCGKQKLAQITYANSDKGKKLYELCWLRFPCMYKQSPFSRRLFNYSLESFKKSVEDYVRKELNKLEISQ